MIDAIEVHNSKTSLASLNRRAREFAAEFGLAAGAGSDAHVPDAIGSAFVEMPDFATAAEFLAALRAGVVVGHHWDEAARVVRPHRPVVLIGFGLTPGRVLAPDRPNA